MLIKKIDLVNYRNYTNLSLPLAEGINIFLGQNAQGKTNVLEAVYYTALTHSHRTKSDDDLIGRDASESSIMLLMDRHSVENEINIKLYRQKTRQIFLSGQKIKAKDLIGTLNVVLFSPEDLFLIKGAPQGRRRFLDAEISQANPRYFNDLMIYNRLLQQRNALLKKIREKKASRDMLFEWDFQLAELAAKVVKKRLSSIEKLNELAGMMQRRLSGNSETLSVVYQIHGTNSLLEEELVSWYNKRLRESVELDILRGYTSVGPQRDDLVFSVNGDDLKTFGSQGQQRTGILALKLAELEFLHIETGDYPILLLDDVMSELDSGRRNELLEFVLNEKIQTLITATEKAYFPEEYLTSYYKVEKGIISKQ